MAYLAYAVVIWFLGMMVLSGGVFTLFGIIGCIYVAKAAYEDFSYKPEDDEDADTLVVADDSGEQPKSESPDDPPSNPDVDDEIAIATQTQSPRGNARVANSDFTCRQGDSDFVCNTDVG
jgi:hypothetical protein